jgi:hypothetical protein
MEDLRKAGHQVQTFVTSPQRSRAYTGKSLEAIGDFSREIAAARRDLRDFSKKTAG